MATLNRVILIGNLTRDPELKFLASGSAIGTFAIAVNSKYKQGDAWKEEVSYFDIVTFGKTAQAVLDHVGKGQSVLIDGRLRQERWEKDGQKRSAVKVIADNVQFLSRKEAEEKQAPPPDEDIPF